MENLKIVGLVSENVKRITAISLKFDGTLQVIGGDNGQGKTSILDAIWLTIGGRQASSEVNAPSPIRDGETEAFATVDLGELLATRRWWYDVNGKVKTEVKVTTPDGAAYKSPQAILDQFTSMLGIDPVMFAQLDAKKQTAVLLDLVKLGIDPVALDLQYADVFAKRTAENAKAKEFTERLKGYPQPPEGLPAQHVSSKEVFDALEAGKAVHNERRRAELAVKHAQEQLALSQQALQEAQRRVGEDQAAALAAVETLGVHQETALPDIGKLTAAMHNVDTLNMQIKSENDRQAGVKALEAVKASADNMTATLDKIKAAKADGLARAVWPIDGLSFGEGGLTFNGQPFSQVASFEMIEISLAMGAAMNPNLRTVFIRDGSLLDGKSMQRVAEWAAAKNFQVIVERVGNHDAGAIIMQDGAAV